MIIEDGDACLVPRKSDNMSTISSLLNLSDGIMGSIIDIKMIISTNADIKEMDQAIMRPGRLCRNICVGPLPYEQANKIFIRLMNKDDSKLEYRKYYTLAEIYAKANNFDSSAEYQNQFSSKRTIGFASPDKDLTINSSNLEIK
jgi:ATP-dependent 26S proteasome regulatory subunit